MFNISWSNEMEKTNDYNFDFVIVVALTLFRNKQTNKHPKKLNLNLFLYTILLCNRISFSLVFRQKSFARFENLSVTRASSRSCMKNRNEFDCVVSVRTNWNLQLIHNVAPTMIQRRMRSAPNVCCRYPSIAPNTSCINRTSACSSAATLTGVISPYCELLRRKTKRYDLQYCFLFCDHAL